MPDEPVFGADVVITATAVATHPDGAEVPAGEPVDENKES